MLKRLILVVAVVLGCVGCDQVTKLAARSHLADAPATSYLHDTIRLTYAENPGAFLGLGAALSGSARVALLQGLVSALILGLIATALLRPGLNGSQVAALALLAASGLGNLIDRLLYDGRVTDFLNLGVGALRTGIFNVADVAGVLGAVLFLLSRGTPGRDESPGLRRER